MAVSFERLLTAVLSFAIFSSSFVGPISMAFFINPDGPMQNRMGCLADGSFIILARSAGFISCIDVHGSPFVGCEELLHEKNIAVDKMTSNKMLRRLFMMCNGFKLMIE